MTTITGGEAVLQALVKLVQKISSTWLNSLGFHPIVLQRDTHAGVPEQARTVLRVIPSTGGFSARA